MVQVRSGCKIKIQNSKFKTPLLSPDDLAFWDKNGYVVIPKAVPEENLRAVVDDIWWFLGMNLDDPDDWYHAPHHRRQAVAQCECVDKCKGYRGEKTGGNQGPCHRELNAK